MQSHDLVQEDVMPTRVGRTFTPQRKKRKYDFRGFHGHDLTDGQVWRLDRGKDYECSEQNLRQHARAFAAEHGLQFGFQVLKGERGPLGVELAFVPTGASLPGGLPGGAADDAGGRASDA
jgi:hypothetical protein